MEKGLQGDVVIAHTDWEKESGQTGLLPYPTVIIMTSGLSLSPSPTGR